LNGSKRSLPSVNALGCRFIPNADNCANLLTIVLVQHRAYCMPFLARDFAGFTRLLVGVTTAVAGDLFAAVYTNDNTGGLHRPGLRLAQIGPLSTNTSGEKSGTVAPLALQDGEVYWLVLVCSAAATVRALQNLAISNLLGFAVGSVSAITHLYTTITGSLPAVLSAESFTSGVGGTPVVYLAP
jgi:hypothetical protein